MFELSTHSDNLILNELFHFCNITHGGKTSLQKVGRRWVLVKTPSKMLCIIPKITSGPSASRFVIQTLRSIVLKQKHLGVQIASW